MGTTIKALSLLDYFTRARPLIGLSDMARLSSMNKATVHRLMTELATAGFVEQAGTGREYRLGPAVMRLAALRESAVPMREVASQVLHDLSNEVDETAHFSLMRGSKLSTVSYAYSPVHGTRVTMDDAEDLLLHATSSGLAVLAYSSTDLVDQILSEPLEACTSDTLTDPQEIRLRLAQVRESGVAVSVSGFEDDVFSHAAPIFDVNGDVLGAIAVAAPTARVDDVIAERIKESTKTHALRLTRMLGGFPPMTYPRNDRPELAKTEMTAVATPPVA